MADERLILYTSAPRDFDGFSTIELSVDAGRDNRGKVLRKVSLEPRDREWQTGRYLSGLHGFTTPEEAAKYPDIWKITG